MANFQRQYTGENFGVRLSDDKIGPAQQRMNNLILSADQMVYDSFKENEKRFASMTDVDLETYLSTASANAQSKMVEDYNKIATDIVRKRKGFQNLTPEDWQELNLGRKVLEGKQKQMIANQERYLTDREMVQRNPDKYDVDRWNKQFATEYLQKGQYPEAPLPIKAIDVTKHLMESSQKISREYSPTPVEKTEGNIRYRATKTTNLLPEEVDDFIIGTILPNPQAVQGLISEFESEPESVKVKYLDTSGDGIIDEGERSVANAQNMGRNNPLIRYALENPKYRQAAVTPKMTSWQPISTPSNKGVNTSNWSTLVAFGSTTKYMPTESQTTRLGETDYNKYHSYNNLTTRDIPVGTEIRKLDPEGEEVIRPNTTIATDLTGYDEEKDEFTFVAKSNFENVYGATPKGSGWRIAIKRKDLPPEYGELEVMQGGNSIKIKDIQRGQMKGATESGGSTLKDKLRAIKKGE